MADSSSDTGITLRPHFVWTPIMHKRFLCGYRGYGETKSPSGLTCVQKPIRGFCVTEANLALQGVEALYK